MNKTNEGKRKRNPALHMFCKSHFFLLFTLSFIKLSVFLSMYVNNFACYWAFALHRNTLQYLILNTYFFTYI